MALTIVSVSRCGFCGDGNHARCAVGVKHDGPTNKYPGGVVWACACESGGCKTGRRKCSHCNNRTTEEVNPETWECFDVEGCRLIVEARREADPLHRQLREIEETVRMAKIEDNKDKATKAATKKQPVDCTCGCGDQTKGGKFLPGHDARYVSERVSAIFTSGKHSAKAEKDQRAKIKKDGVSDALVAKFEKSLGLAVEKENKKAEAKAAKDAEAKEKASANA